MPQPNQLTDQNVPELNLSPNSTSGHFVVDMKMNNDLSSTATLQVVNILGQVVLNEEVNIVDGQLNHDVNLNSDASQGMYLVRLIVADQVYSGQIIYQH